MDYENVKHFTICHSVDNLKGSVTQMTNAMVFWFASQIIVAKIQTNMLAVTALLALVKMIVVVTLNKTSTGAGMVKAPAAWTMIVWVRILLSMKRKYSVDAFIFIGHLVCGQDNCDLSKGDFKDDDDCCADIGTIGNTDYCKIKWQNANLKVKCLSAGSLSTSYRIF